MREVDHGTLPDGVELGQERDGTAGGERVPPGRGHVVDRLHDDSSVAAARQPRRARLLVGDVELEEMRA
jgi:hypothetical protein